MCMYKRIKETSVKRVTYQYDNTSLEGRTALYTDLDGQYGELGYKVVRCGPMVENYEVVHGLGMMIIEVEYKVY